MELAIIGSGKLIPTAMEAIAQVPQLTPYALFVRPQSLEKGKALAEQFHIPVVYTDYEQLLSDQKVKAVYIALVNSVHYRYAQQALDRKKHVLMEKPFTVYTQEAEDLRDRVRRSGTVLMEAITPRHTLTYQRLREVLPQLGIIRLVMANFSQYSSRYDAYLRREVAPAFDPRQQGGALYDMNVYNISILIGLFGKPERIRYNAVRGFNGVDTSGVLLCQYPHFTASLAAAKNSDGPSFFLIQGEKGWARLEGPPNEAAALTVHIGQEEKYFRPAPEKNRMVREFRDFADLAAKPDQAVMEADLEHTVHTVELLETAIYGRPIHVLQS